MMPIITGVQTRKNTAREISSPTNQQSICHCQCRQREKPLQHQSLRDLTHEHESAVEPHIALNAETHRSHLPKYPFSGCLRRGRPDTRGSTEKPESRSGTVLLVHTAQDAAHPGPEDNEGKHSTKPAKPARTMPLSMSATSAASTT